MPKQMSSKNQEIITGYAFLAPFMAGLAVFVLAPIFYTVYLSLVDYNSIGRLSNLKFVGFRNYLDVLRNPSALDSYLRSLQYTLVYVPCMIVFSLLMAYLMNKSFKFRTLSRTMIFMPYVANVMAVSIVFNVILNPFEGPVNAFLRIVGVEHPPMWLIDPKMALPVTALVATWQNLTFQTIVFLAAMQEVPAELFEAADIEGAGGWTTFRRIILPWISPTTFFLVVTTIIGSTQNFSGIYTLTRGGPGEATEVAIISIYKNAFEFNKFSFASAQSLILFALLLVITIIQWKGQKKWVHY
jgi:multiple sugar transport system permease protein